MNETLIAAKLELTELANKLFMYTDALQWNKLLEEVFTEQVHFDMSSASGETPQMLTAKAICDMWQQGLGALDAVHHQAGHYLITVNKGNAVFMHMLLLRIIKEMQHRAVQEHLLAATILKQHLQKMAGAYLNSNTILNT